MFYFKIDEDIQLKLLEIGVAEELYLLTDKDRSYLREWLPWVDGTKSAEDTKAFIQSTLKQISENNGFQAGIFYKGNIAGCIGLHGIDWSNKKTTIGYWLGAEYQGKGIMSQACKAIIDHVFVYLKLNRVEIRAATFNKKSRAIPERLSFKNEGEVRQVEWINDHYVDHVIYGMLAGDWKDISTRGAKHEKI
jgi:ribosomal-protein-serine acetyltransferase